MHRIAPIRLNPGNVADIMLDCLAVYPATFASYQANKQTVKQALRPQMRRLKAVLDKSLFDGGNADYLSIHSGPATDPVAQKHFHIFHKDDVTTSLLNDFEVDNSQARRAGEVPEQKVVFKSLLHGKQVGEIEDRHDGAKHYREMKFRLEARKVFEILRSSHEGNSKLVRKQATAYGRAAQLFK